MINLSNKRAENWLLDLEMWRSVVVSPRSVSIGGEGGNKEEKTQMESIDNSLEEFCCKGKQKNEVVDEGGDGVEEGVITIHNK